MLRDEASSGYTLETNVSTTTRVRFSPPLPGCCTFRANIRQVSTLVQPFAQILSVSLYGLHEMLCGCLGTNTTGSGEQSENRHGFQPGTLVARHTVEI